MKCTLVRFIQCALVFALPISVAGLQPGVDGSGCWEALCAIEGRFYWGGGCGVVVDTIFFSFFIDFECRRAANGRSVVLVSMRRTVGSRGILTATLGK